MKNKIMRTAGVALVASTALLRADVASLRADVASSNWYVEPKGDIGFRSKVKCKEAAHKFELKSKTVWGGQVAFGYYLNENVRFEIAPGYRHAKLKDIRYKSLVGVGEIRPLAVGVAPVPNAPKPAGTKESISGYASTFNVMFNAYYDYPVMDNVDLWVGAGVGYANTRNKLGDWAKSSASAFAYNAMAGVTYKFTDDWSASLGYRFYGETNNKVKVGGTNKKLTLKDAYTHFVEVGVRYSF